jgi:hypothetical protein
MGGSQGVAVRTTRCETAHNSSDATVVEVGGDVNNDGRDDVVGGATTGPPPCTRSTRGS